MHLQISKNGYPNVSPPPATPEDFFDKDRAALDFRPDGPEFEPENEPVEVDLPMLATANDLREVVKFFKYKRHGVSSVEISSAEPRRVFDVRKMAAYEFWGVLSRANERLQLTPLGEELAKNTETESEIHRRILHNVPAYRTAVEWIFKQKLEIATYFDVANFWQSAGGNLALSPPNEENIEAVIVSFFSLCHTAELGTATVGKRGQPARLSVRLEQFKAFLEAPPENGETAFQPAFFKPEIYRSEQTGDENITSVYVSAGRGEVTDNLRSALGLADFESFGFGAEKFENGFLPLLRRTAMKKCQAAIFLLDEKDLTAAQNGKHLLRCDRVTEISVAQALFNERVIFFWNSREKIPPVLEQAGFNVFDGDISDWEANVKLVKCLKILKSRISQSS